jgi:homopolymeric O-antigen transport system ATP-binding protein
MDAIRFEHVSKIYRGEDDAYRSLRDDVTWLVTMGRRGGDHRSQVRALDDVSFEVPAGQSTAIIGHNGAGKSTALKIASRISFPNSGRVSVRGRVGSLIEVGTGLHPELSGRENVRLFGRILGLSGQQVRARFDDIVEFAGLPHAIDQPVKQYSSGMQLRLGFSIAAHLEPDILIVDEALSVGDAAFQFRCIERMSKLAREGRTLIFVSHNLMAVESICERVILLSHGRIEADGRPRDVIEAYYRDVHASLLEGNRQDLTAHGDLDIESVSLRGPDGREVSAIHPGDPLTVRIHYRAARRIDAPAFQVGVADPGLGAITIASMLSDGHSPDAIEGAGWLECTFDSLPLKPRVYDIFGSAQRTDRMGRLVPWQRIARFAVETDLSQPAPGRNAATLALSGAPVVMPYRWRFSEAG